MTILYVTRFPAFLFANIEKITLQVSTVYASILLFLCTFYVFCQQSFGEFIHCSGFHAEQHEQFAKAFGTFCFYNIRARAFPSDVKTSEIGFDVSVNNHNIYQWMPYILMFQTVLFYLPHKLLKCLEGTKFKSATIAFEKATASLRKSEEMALKPKKLYVAYRKFLHNLDKNNYYPLAIPLGEFFNVILIVLQIYLMKVNLGVRFYEDVQTENHFDYVFPKHFDCTQPKLGANGTLEYIDGRCELPLNYVYENIYTYLWICVNLLLGSTVMILWYRLLSWGLYSKSNGFNRFEFSRMCWGSLKQDDLMVTSKWDFSRWLVLRRLAGEISAHDFDLLIDALRMNEEASDPPDEA